MLNKKLKIGLFPLHSFNRPGGVKNHVLALQKEFKKRGYTCKIIVPRRLRKERYGQDIKLFGVSLPMFFNGAQSDFTFCARGIKKLLQEEKFDILHFHNFGLHSAQIIEQSLATNVLTFHSDINLAASRLFKTFPYFLKKFQKIVNKKVDGIIGIAPFVMKNFPDFSGPTAVIPNGINLKMFNFQRPTMKKHLDPEKINLLFLGRLEERKGLIYLLRAYRLLKKRFDGLRLMIVGEGPEKERCQQFIAAHQLQDIFWEGIVPEERVPSFYRSCDIYVSPAIFGESFGIVLLEAMACGKPVVAFANRGYQRVLQGKGKEFLAKPKDWRSLAQKIEILIKNGRKRKEMGEWGRQEAQKYAWPKIAKKVLTFYQTVRQLKES